MEFFFSGIRGLVGVGVQRGGGDVLQIPAVRSSVMPFSFNPFPHHHHHHHCTVIVNVSIIITTTTTTTANAMISSFFLPSFFRGGG